MDDQSFEFLLNNFARLTNIISEECPTFALFRSVFRLHLLYVVFKLCTLKVKGLEPFRACAFCLKLRVNGGMLRFLTLFYRGRGCMMAPKMFLTTVLKRLGEGS